MSYKQSRIQFNEKVNGPVHTEENRLARRLFQLENRMQELVSRVEEMNEMLHMLIAIDAFDVREGEFPMGFCMCDAEDDDEDDEDEEEF
jgi:hypothetical protein